MSLAALVPPCSTALVPPCNTSLVAWPLRKSRLPACFDPTARRHAPRAAALVPTLAAAAVLLRAPAVREAGSSGAAQPRRGTTTAATAATASALALALAFALALALALALACRGAVRRAGGGVAAAGVEQARGDEDGERGLRVDGDPAEVGGGARLGLGLGLGLGFRLGLALALTLTLTLTLA